MAQQSQISYAAHYLFCDTRYSASASRSAWYYICMTTKLLEEAIERLRALPKPMQDSAARALIMQFEEEPEDGDRAAISAGRAIFRTATFPLSRKW